MNNLINMNDFIKTQQSNVSAKSSYDKYQSKQVLIDSGTLTSKPLVDALKTMTNCFSFDLHVSRKYMVLTMYFNSTKSYEYYVIVIDKLQMVKCESVKSGKQLVQSMIDGTFKLDTTK